MKADYIRIRVRTKDKEDLKKMLEEDMPMSEFLYDYVKQSLTKIGVRSCNIRIRAAVEAGTITREDADARIEANKKRIVRPNN